MSTSGHGRLAAAPKIDCHHFLGGQTIGIDFCALIKRFPFAANDDKRENKQLNRFIFRISLVGH